jgi:hypothetical protein
VGEAMTGTKVVGFVIARPEREVVAKGVFSASSIKSPSLSELTSWILMPSARGFLPPLPPLPRGRPPLPLPRPRPMDGGVSAAADDGDPATPANAPRPLPLPRLPRGRPPRFLPRPPLTAGVVVESIDMSTSSSFTRKPVSFVLSVSSVVEVVMFFKTAFRAASHSWVP